MGEAKGSGEEIAATVEAQSREVEQKSKQVGLSQQLDEVRPEDIIQKASCTAEQPRT